MPVLPLLRLQPRGFAAHRRQAYGMIVTSAMGSGLMGFSELTGTSFETPWFLGVAARTFGLALGVGLIQRAVRSPEKIQAVGSRSLTSAYWGARSLPGMVLGAVSLGLAWFMFSLGQDGWVSRELFWQTTIGGSGVAAAGIYLIGRPIVDALRRWRKQRRQPA